MIMYCSLGSMKETMLRTYYHLRTDTKIFHKIHSITLDRWYIQNRISCLTMNSDNMLYLLKLLTFKYKLTTLKCSLINAISACNTISEIQHYTIDKNLDPWAIKHVDNQEDKSILNPLLCKGYLIKSIARWDWTGGFTMVCRFSLAFDEHQKYSFKEMEFAQHKHST